MTREEAVLILTRLEKGCDEHAVAVLTNYAKEAFQMAITALQTDGDCISRQGAIDAIRNMCEECDSDYCGECRVGRNDCEKVLEGLPSAQPLVIHCTDCEDWLKRQSVWNVAISELPSTHPEGLCEYCHEDSDGYVKPIEKNSHAFVRFGMDGWELSLKANGWHGSAKIRYCPMCGRRLERG